MKKLFSAAAAIGLAIGLWCGSAARADVATLPRICNAAHTVCINAQPVQPVDNTGTLTFSGSSSGGGAASATARATAPSYTEGDTAAPLSLNLTGDLRTIAKQSGTWTVGQSGSWTVGQTGTWTVNQGGTWNIGNITGTVSLPTGAATAANQTTASTTLSTIATQIGATSSPASGTTNYLLSQILSGITDTSASHVIIDSSALATGAATASNQSTANTTLSTIATNTTGVATAANQSTANSSLSTIASNTTGVATAANQSTANSSLSTIATNTTNSATNTGTTATALGAPGDSAYTGIGSASVVSILKGLYAAPPPSTISGDVAAAATDSGNPVKVGGVYNTTQPAYTNGQRGNLQMTAKGFLLSTNVFAASNGGDSVSNALSGKSQDAGGSAVYTAIMPWYYNGSTWDRWRGDTNGAYAVMAPSAATSVATTTTSCTTACSSLVAKSSSGNLYGFQVTSGTTAGYVMAFNATSAPADGTVTPLKCYAVAASASRDVKFEPPVSFNTGMTLVFSTGTDCFTKTASATVFMSGDVK